MKFCPKCNACNSNGAEKCFKCNYSFSSDNPKDNTIASTNHKSDNENGTITFELINYENYQKNLDTLNPILQHNNKSARFEIYNSTVNPQICVFVNNMKIGSVPQDKTKYFLQEDMECKINNVSIANNNNLLIPSISVICSKKQPKPNTSQQSSNSNTTIKKNSDDNDTQHTNSIAMAIRVIAVLTYICGFFTGIVLGDNLSSFYSYNWTAAIICWIASIIIGTFILGFSEIIKLLDEIKNKK